MPSGNVYYEDGAICCAKIPGGEAFCTFPPHTAGLHSWESIESPTFNTTKSEFIKKTSDPYTEGIYDADDLKTTRDAAIEFMERCGLEPTRDAIDQLAEVFLPCLRIMTTRGYDPDGETWRAEGWKGIIGKILDKSNRIWYHGWKHGRFHDDSVLDLINFAGFYRRLGHTGEAWGVRGEPGYE